MSRKEPLKLAAIMENDRVRVLEVTYKPGEVAKMHHHPDHVIYVKKGGKLKVTSEGKKSEIDFTAGQAIFMKAQDHEAENIGKTPVVLVVVELKK